MPFKSVPEGQKGYSLIELLIVVVIVGVLAAIAIPNFMTYQCRAKQSEARANLGNIRQAIEAYYAEHKTYDAGLSRVGFEVKGNARYNYTVSGNSTGFIAVARTGDLNGTADRWEINSTGVLTNVTKACVN